MTAREDILARIRTALGRERIGVRVPEVFRGYRVAGSDNDMPRPAVLDDFVDRLTDYQATVHRCTLAEVADTIASAAQDLETLIVPPGLDEALLSALPGGVTLLRDESPLPLDALDSAGGVVTTCSVAIARTGTIVLDAGPGQGRRALSLVPDWHLCVVDARQVVPAVPDGLTQLDPRRPLTFISGPSATSDIELQRVEGVHGPRTLVVVLIED